MKFASLVLLCLAFVCLADSQSYYGLKKLDHSKLKIAKTDAHFAHYCAEKEYYVSQYYKISWREAWNTCHSYGLKFVTLKTKEEADYFTKLCAANTELFLDNYAFIGAIQGTPGDVSTYQWVETGQALNYAVNWSDSEPNNLNGTQWCMAVRKQPDQFMFDDNYCDNVNWRFVCEK